MNTKNFTLALASVIAFVSIAALAMGFDLQTILATHADTASGLAMLGAGSIEMMTKALDKIEGGLGSIKERQAEFADRLLQVEQRPRGRMDGPSTPAGLGDLVASEFAKKSELFASTRQVRLEIKAAGDAVTTGSGRTVLGVGVGAPGGSVLGMQNALPIRNATGVTTGEYSRFTGLQGAAAQQAAEGDAKAAVRPDHSLISQPAITLAGYTKLSRQAISDSNELRVAVETTLNRSVATALDTALVNGATGFGGYESLATASTSLVYTSLVDAISEAVAAMQIAGFTPNAVILNPSDWLAATVAKGTANDHYLSGDYLGKLPSEMRGLKVTLSPSIDAGKALVMDTAHSEMMVVDGFAIEVAYSGDDFTKNLVTVLAETRIIPVFRSVGSAKLITPKA